MLKIKDDFNLEELEKYGFDIPSEDNDYECYYFDVLIQRNPLIYDSLEVDCETREISIRADYGKLYVDRRILDKLYELINVGIIEEE